MVNFFSQLGSADHPLTATLLALLEHTDRTILASLLTEAGLEPPPLGEAQFRYPARDLPDVGEISMADHRLQVVALRPGEEPPDLLAAEETLYIGAGQQSNRPGAVQHAAHLSWERFDRWLLEMASRFDAESRTGFLLRQFHAYLPEVGIRYFTGFEPGELAEMPKAFAHLAAFYKAAAELFQHLERAGEHPLTLIREARAEDLLAGYCYRDFAHPWLEQENFLRLALDLGAAQFEIACWLLSPSRSHQRLLATLQQPTEGLAGLSQFDPEPHLRLWSPEIDQVWALNAFEPGQLAGLNEEALTIAVQVSYPLTDLAGEGLVERLQGWAAALMAHLRPLFTDVLH